MVMIGRFVPSLALSSIIIVLPWLTVVSNISEDCSIRVSQMLF